MSVTFRAASSANGGSGTSASFAITLPAGWQAGDWVAVAITMQGSFDPAWNTLAGWTLAYNDFNYGNANIVNAVYWRVMQAGDASPTFTSTDAAATWAWVAIAMSPGAGGTLSVDGSSSATFTAGGTSFTPPAKAAVASAVASVLLTASSAVNAGATAITVTPPAGWTEPAGGDTSTAVGAAATQVGAECAYKTGTSGTVTPGAETTNVAVTANTYNFLVTETASGASASLSGSGTMAAKAAQRAAASLSGTGSLTGRASNQAALSGTGTLSAVPVTPRSPAVLAGRSAYVATDGSAPGAITPATGTQDGDLLVFYHYSAVTGGSETVTIPAGFTPVQNYVSAGNGLIAVGWRIRASGDTTFQASVTGHTAGASGETVIEWIETWRGFDASAPIGSVTATPSAWAATTSPLGPVSPPAAAALLPAGTVVVFAGSHGVCGTASLLAGDSLDWYPGAVSDSTSGADAGVRTQYGVNHSAASLTVTSKSITESPAAGSAATGAGLMFTIAGALLDDRRAQVVRGIHNVGPDYGAADQQATFAFDNTIDSGYHYEQLSSLKFLASRGTGHVIVSPRWERMQPAVNVALEPIETRRLLGYLDRVAASGMRAVLSAHNFGLYYTGGGTPDATPTGTRSAMTGTTFAGTTGLWPELRDKVLQHPAIAAVSIMCEPQPTGGLTQAVWQSASQSAVTAIRASYPALPIWVNGWNFATCSSWSAANTTAWLTADASVFYETHHYWDSAGGGAYPSSYAAEVANAVSAGYSAGAYADALQNKIMTELANFTSWCTSHSVRGVIGEIGWPGSATGIPSGDQVSWNALAGIYLGRLDQQSISCGYWGCGEAEYPSARLDMYTTTAFLSPLVNVESQASVVEAHESFLPVSGAALSGTGTVSATAAARVTAAIAGAGALTGAAVLGPRAALAGTGSLAGTAAAAAAASLAGTGAAGGKGTQPCTASLSGLGASIPQAAASLSGTGSLSGSVRWQGAAAVSGAGSLTASTAQPAIAARPAGSSQLASGSGATSLTLTVPSTIAAGDIAVCAAIVGHTGLTITQTAGTGAWTLLSATGPGATNSTYLFAYRQWQSGDTAPTFGWGAVPASWEAVNAAYFSTLGATMTFDQWSAVPATAAAANAITAPSLSGLGASSGELAVVLSAGLAATSITSAVLAYTPPSGFTAEKTGESSSSPVRFAAIDHLLSTAASTESPGASSVTDSKSNTFDLSAVTLVASAGALAAAGTASLSGSGDATTGSDAAQLAPASLTGTGAVTSAAVQQAAAPLTGAGVLAAAAILGPRSTLSGAGALAAAVTQRCKAALAGTGSLAAQGGITGTAALSGTGSLSAKAAQPSAAHLSGTASIAAIATNRATAALAADGGTLTASGGEVHPVIAVSDSDTAHFWDQPPTLGASLSGAGQMSACSGLVNDYETGTVSAQVSPANSGGAADSRFDAVTVTAGQSLTYDSTYAHSGTQSMAVSATPGGTAAATWSAQLGTGAFPTVAFRAYVNPGTAYPSGTLRLGQFWSDKAATVLAASLSLSATGRVVVTGAAGSPVITSATGLPLGQWSRVEGHITGDPASGTLSLQIWTGDPDGTLPDESDTVTGVATSGQVAAVSWGAVAATATGAYWLDDVAAGLNGPIGPTSPSLDAAISGTGSLSAAWTGTYTAAPTALAADGGILGAAPIQSCRAALTGTGSLAASGAIGGSQAITGTGTLAATTVQGQSAGLAAGDSPLDASATLSVTAGLFPDATSIAAIATTLASAALPGTGTLSAAVTQPASAPLTGTGTLAAIVTRQPLASISGTGQITSPLITQPAAAPLSGTAAITAKVRQGQSAALSGAGQISASMATWTARSSADTATGYEGEIRYITGADTASGAGQAGTTGIAHSDSATAAEAGTPITAALAGTGQISADSTSLLVTAASAPLSGTGAMTSAFPQHVPVSAADAASAAEDLGDPVAGHQGIGVFPVSLAQSGPGGYFRVIYRGMVVAASPTLSRRMLELAVLAASGHHFHFVSAADAVHADDYDPPHPFAQVSASAGPSVSVTVSAATRPMARA